jgi:hypothetical protein
MDSHRKTDTIAFIIIFNLNIFWKLFKITNIRNKNWEAGVGSHYDAMMTTGVSSRLRSEPTHNNDSKAPKDDDDDDDDTTTTNATSLSLSSSAQKDDGRNEKANSDCNHAMDTGNTNDVGVNVVAIVGAGFAGLVLANYLELQSREHEDEHQPQKKLNNNPPYRWEYKLFESKSRSGIPVIGTIRLESARDALEELCLFEEACRRWYCEPNQNQNGAAAGQAQVQAQAQSQSQSAVFPKRTHTHTTSASTSTSMDTKNDNDDDDNYRVVSRESFLELLRKNVTIQSSSRVVDIIEGSLSGNNKNNSNNPTPNHFVVTEGDGGERAEHGPFDLVVAANGLSFRGQTTKTLRQTLKSAIPSLSSSTPRSIVRIGDCRYSYGRAWWEFDFLGATRRKSGADSAIRDGLGLGRRLLQCQRQQEKDVEPLRFQLREGAIGNVETSSSSSSLTDVLFCSPRNNDRRMLRRGKVLLLIRIAVVILLPIILALTMYY